MIAPIGLVVDDNPGICALFARTLRDGGMHVLEARSGAEALELTQIVKPAFVVTDIEMAGLDGLELCRRLRQCPRNGKVVIVVVSAAAGSQGDEATAAGCDVVLEKPCPPAVLLRTIRQLIEGRPDPPRSSATP